LCVFQISRCVYIVLYFGFFLCIFLCVFGTWILTFCFMFPGELMFWFGLLWCVGYESYCDVMCCWWIVTNVGIDVAAHTTMFLTLITYIFSTQLQFSNGKCKKQGSSDARRRHLSLLWEHVVFLTRKFLAYEMFLTVITYIFSSLVATLQWKVHVHAARSRAPFDWLESPLGF
jgi:hypothetical protein